MDDEKSKVLVNRGWVHISTELNSRSSKIIFQPEEEISESDYFDGLLYLPAEDFCLRQGEPPVVLQDEIEIFGKLVTLLNGLEGKCLFLGVDYADRMFEKETVKGFRLVERGCDWFWGFQEKGESNESMEKKIVEYFEERLQYCVVKPAKKG